MIPVEMQEAFDQLGQAIETGKVALVQCRRNDTNEVCYIMCLTAVTAEGLKETQMAVAPMALMLTEDAKFGYSVDQAGLAESSITMGNLELPLPGAHTDPNQN